MASSFFSKAPWTDFSLLKRLLSFASEVSKSQLSRRSALTSAFFLKHLIFFFEAAWPQISFWKTLASNFFLKRHNLSFLFWNTLASVFQLKPLIVTFLPAAPWSWPQLSFWRTLTIGFFLSLLASIFFLKRLRLSFFTEGLYSQLVT